MSSAFASKCNCTVLVHNASRAHERARRVFCERLLHLKANGLFLACISQKVIHFLYNMEGFYENDTGSEVSVKENSFPF